MTPVKCLARQIGEGFQDTFEGVVNIALVCHLSLRVGSDIHIELVPEVLSIGSKPSQVPVDGLCGEKTESAEHLNVKREVKNPTFVQRRRLVM
jgi:hypothetical protein